MPAFDDDDDRELGGSQDGSSDNELDETMRDGDDAEADGDGEEDIDADADADGDENDDAASQSGGSQGSDTFDQPGEQGPANQDDPQNSVDEQGSTKGLPNRPSVRPEILAAATYDIVPTIAAPQSTSINAITATADTRWVFSGGSDGYIRRYNWVDSVNSKLMLTVAQRHPFVDSVVKAGVLMSYWENWDSRPKNTASQSVGGGPSLSPVYALAVQSQGLWLLSGTDSGTIRLQSLRHDEGKEITLLQQHTSAISVLTLSSDEKYLLSGSWDKSVLDWDLNTGKVRTAFASTAGQVSSIEARPVSSVPVPVEAGEQSMANGTYSSNNAKASSLQNGVNSRAPSQPPHENPQPGATPDSLFGGDDGDDDLFGDSGGAVMSNGGDMADAYGEEDDMARAMADGPRPEDSTDITMQDDMDPIPSQIKGSQDNRSDDSQHPETDVLRNGESSVSDQTIPNGLPHAADDDQQKAESDKQQDPPEAPPTSDSTFLATSIDGTIRVWDRRQPDPVARILPRNTPPWCLSACWSPDGNYIFAGRRNNTVEEYDLRKGLRSPERIFRFPGGSGAVTSVRAMPNGRHLICASHDILRLYDLKEPETTRSTVPFLIVPGHRTGVVSHLYMDPASRFMISTGGNRGWEGQSTEVLLGYEIGVPA